ncbi:DMT family transporter [Alloalcanivorax sp. C16-2]|uniref:DMT family transporter n=1 Tax=Alloalcanivorax TaxID=3020832 RepID=UPI001932CB24|nr:DMT family transporter [Alloalcanivorax marinus]MBL7251902.1 DMT family transporter [Alloalcanivorax marinus]
MDTRKGTALALLASAQWGATGIWVALLRDLPTGTTLVFRFLTATLLLTTMLAALRGFRRPNRSALEGGVLLAAYYVLATVGFYISDVVTVSLLVATSPFFVMLLRLLRREGLTGRELLGGLLAFGGVATVLLLGAPASGESHLVGNLCGLGAALVMALYSRAGDRLRGQGWNVVWIACALGLLVSAPFADPGAAVPDARQWGLFLGLAAFSTLAPGYLYPLACQHINATSATVVRLSTPFFTALFAFLILGDALGMQHVLGAPLLLLGVYLTLPRPPARA